MYNLTVYKASAGSGKTFRLTLEYIKLILKKPEQYKNILAITFTNKATEEMKGRIIEQLHNLANGENSSYKSLLLDETNLSDDEIETKAQKAEQYILHDYGRFSVMTIDAFFQTIIKSFAKELGISYNYNVELDNEIVLTKALERMFQELNKDKQLRRWLRDFAVYKIDNGKSWNITDDIKNLSKQLFSEKMQFMDKQLAVMWSNKGFLNDFINKLNTTIANYENECIKIGKKAMQVIEKHNATIDDFLRKKTGIAGFFQKTSQGNIITTPSKTVLASLDNPEKWYSKSSSEVTRRKVEASYIELNILLKRFLTLIEEQAPIYLGCINIKKNIHIVGIFSDIARHVYNIMDEDQKVLLSECNKLLYKMIADTEIPFIYEKTGAKYLHFLWDEFQDTSQMQWFNLEPLLTNALSQGQSCLLVGDIKQAIYRWRNGDWRILGEGVHKTFPYLKEEHLQKNWRSTKRIIDFNNAIFSDLPKWVENKFELEKNSVGKLYVDAQQEYITKDIKEEGYVSIQFTHTNDNDTAQELILRKLPRIVEELQGKGIKPKDIAFLVRKNSEGVLLANYFAQLEDKKKGVVYDLVSNESLLLKNSLTVSIIESALNWLTSNAIYYKETTKKLTQYLPSSSDKFAVWSEYCMLSNSKQSTILEVLHKCINTFELYDIQGEFYYLTAFEELVLDYIEKYQGGLYSFLEWWLEHKKKATISTSSDIDAMKILTVHKSKGLEFNTVIMPFVVDSLKNKNKRGKTTLWATSDTYPFNMMGTVLLSYVENLQNTIFSDTYYQERYSYFIDTINLFYVATTRAVNNLFIFMPMSQKSDVSIASLLFKNIENATPNSFWANNWDADLHKWEFGTIKSTTNSKIRHKELYINKLYYKKVEEHLPLNQSIVDSNIKTSIMTKTPIEIGNMWHDILKDIKYYENIENALKKLYLSGKITTKEVSQYKEKLDILLKNEQIAEYFTPKYKVYNERKLWVYDEQYIPDRVVESENEIVVLEYKFGEEKKPEHQKQLLNYKAFFENKSYKNVKSYLIYGFHEEIIKL